MKNALVLTGLGIFEMIRTRKQPGTSRNAGCGYAASRISSNLKGSTKQFGWLQAPATKISFLLAASAKPATIRICSFVVVMRAVSRRALCVRPHDMSAEQLTVQFPPHSFRIPRPELRRPTLAIGPAAGREDIALNWRNGLRYRIVRFEK